jgi:hypothetical protein
MLPELRSKGVRRYIATRLPANPGQRSTGEAAVTSRVSTTAWPFAEFVELLTKRAKVGLGGLETSARPDHTTALRATSGSR